MAPIYLLDAIAAGLKTFRQRSGIVSLFAQACVLPSSARQCGIDEGLR